MLRPITGATPYWADGRPCNLYRNGQQVAGWQWQEQAGGDLVFSGTYRDALACTLVGQSHQERFVGKNRFDKERIMQPGAWRSVAGVEGYSRYVLYVEPSTPYTIHKSNFTSDAGKGLYLKIGHLNFATTWAWLLHDVAGTSVAEYKGQSDAAGQIVFWISTANLGGAEVSEALGDVQLEMGTDATPYTPFVPASPSPASSAPILCSTGDLRVEGRNLFNLQTIPYDANIIRRPTGFEMQGYNFEVGELGLPSLAPDTTYTFGRRVTLLSGVLNGFYGQIAFRRASDGVNVSVGEGLGEGYGVATFTTPPGPEGYNRMTVYGSNAGAVALDDIQIVRGAYTDTTMPGYTPHATTLSHKIPPLSGIPADYNADGSVATWEIRDSWHTERVGGALHAIHTKRVGREALTSAGFWSAGTVQENGTLRIYTFPKEEMPTGMDLGGYCSHYPRVLDRNWFVDVSESVKFGQNNTAVYFWPYVETRAEWLAMLDDWEAAGNPLTIVYPLASPVVTDLGPVDLPSYYPATCVQTLPNSDTVDGLLPESTVRARVAYQVGIG